MSATFDLIQDYKSPDALISTAPIWVLLVARWAHPLLYDRAKKASSTDLDGFEERAPVIIVSDCKTLSISQSKDNHVTALQAVLTDSNRNYLSAIMPDDWMMAWMLTDQTQALNLLQSIKERKPCNDFNAGLKFLGRVQSIFRDTNVADDGKPSSNFILTGAGFTEFDFPMFWEPMLVKNASIPEWYQRFGIALNGIVMGTDRSVTDPRDPHAIDVNRMIPALVRVLLGDGAFKGDSMRALPGNLQATPNGGIRVPNLIGQLMGMEWEGGALNYSDMLDIIVGVQKYGNAQGAQQNTPDIFVPDGLKDSKLGKYKETGTPLLGEFPLFMLPMQNTPTWRILQQFLNPAVNEMVMALRPDEDGSVYPQLQVRQLPFSSTKVGNSPPVSKFLEMPRWRVHPKMVKAVKVGRSNALRFNYWHIQGTGPGTAISREIQLVKSPPITDADDIDRAGLRPCSKTVNCLIKDSKQGPDKWRDIIADITAGQHLTLTGMMRTVGIQAPVAPGDNLEFAGVVYHIEALQHQGVIGDDGRRQWFTILHLSHGMAGDEQFAANQQNEDLDATLEEYAGVVETDSVTSDVGQTGYDTLKPQTDSAQE